MLLIIIIILKFIAYRRFMDSNLEKDLIISSFFFGSFLILE